MGSHPREKARLSLTLTLHVTHQKAPSSEGGGPDCAKAADSTEDGVMFFNQCITNACGTVAVLHVALNVYTETPAADDSFIATLAQSLKSKTPMERGKLIAANKAIKAIHDSAACADGKDVSHLFYITLSSFFHRWLLRCLYSVLIAVMFAHSGSVLLSLLLTRHNWWLSVRAGWEKRRAGYSRKFVKKDIP